MEPYIVKVVALRWLNAEHSLLGADVTFSHRGGVDPMCVTGNYDTRLGRELWDEALYGLHGEIAPYVPPPEPTPEEQRAQMPPISKRQLRLTLVRNGISLSDLDAAILAMGDEAIIEWQDASEYRRLHPLLNQVATHLSLTQEQVDAMWQQALTA
ncbi:hypothetical protein [Ochrobactrum sp. SFR4]|uniref:hypothetical protein n=1 Tax=Ochrobactrum sp. SFR4 TaxID=2717368 RepID=UPI001C8C7F06|nr:hypothetical protein [Ochrobactrum sp. SFR4]MBX8825237.1 hypothetical protein [Ochrobactrum sp. SFR4]